MLTKYIEAAMKKAEYEKIEDGTYFGFIPGFKVDWADEASLEACRTELKSVLEDWILFKLWRNDHDFPVVANISLNPKRARRNESDFETRTNKAS